MPQLTVNVEHQIGDRVTLAVDKAHVGLVDGYVVDANCVLYRVAWNDFSNKTHYPFEIRPDKDAEVGLHACKETK